MMGGMKVMEIREGFGLEHLVPGDRPEPAPGPGQVLVRMHSASLNYRDLLTVQGHYNPKQPLPLIPCSDGVGEVVGLGTGVERVKVGDRVATLFAQEWLAGRWTRKKRGSTLGGPLDGTLCELMALDAEGVVPVPEHLSDDEAATLPCAGLTAWSSLVTHGEIRPGDTVLLLGTGGVSIFALQFAQLLGARTIITSSSDEKLERARALGAWSTINYRTKPEWGLQAARLAGGDGVDHVVEVGGAGTVEQSIAAVRPGGTISIIGSLTGGSTELSLIPVLMKQVRLQGIMVGNREGFEAMNRAIDSHRMTPIVSRMLSMSEARTGFDEMRSGGHFGKICLRIP